MRTFLIALLAFVISAMPVPTASGEEVTLSYQLTIDRPETGVGYVTMSVSGLSSKGFSLNRSAAAGESWFDAVKAAGPDGSPLGVVATEDGFYVTTGGAQSATVTYLIRPGTVGEYGHVGLIASDFAALDGSLVFLLPGEEVEIGDAVASFTVPPAWKTITNWPGGPEGYRPEAALTTIRAQLASSLICFGDFAPSTRDIGSNTLAIHIPPSFPQADAAELTALLERIYTRIQGALGFETGAVYNVVCLPPAPDGLPVVAGAWVDGQALTLVGKFSLPETLQYVQWYSRFVALSYLSSPYGVRVPDEDQWLYPAVLAYATGLGSTVSGKIVENLFYGAIYTRYATEASADVSSIDLPASKLPKAAPDAREFLADTKAPILLMRLDYEIRFVTENAKTIDDFLQALYRAPSSPDEVVEPLDVLTKVANADFTEFWDKYVRARTVLLPTWPQFLETIAKQKPDNSLVVAEVEGAQIFKGELDIMSEAIRSEGYITDERNIREAALNALIQERLTDMALSGYRMNVVPEAFWQLRLVLPGRVMKMLAARKRQTLKDLLYNDWLMRATKESAIDIKAVPPAEPQAAPAR
jgi:hypothetical protein